MAELIRTDLVSLENDKLTMSRNGLSIMGKMKMKMNSEYIAHTSLVRRVLHRNSITKIGFAQEPFTKWPFVYEDFTIRMTINSILPVVLGGLFASALLTATAVGASTQILNSVTVSAGVNSPDPNVSDYNFSGLPASASLTSSFGVSSFMGSAQTTSTFGAIRSSVSVDITNYAPESYTTSGANCGGGSFSSCGAGSDGTTILGVIDPATASSTIRDDITISDPAKTGVTGYLDLMFSVTGTTTLTNTSNLDPFYNGPGAQGTLTLYADNNYIKGWGFSGDVALTSPLFAFTYGTPFELRLDSSFFVDPGDHLSPTLTTGDLWSLSGTVDFSNTVLLSQISVFDDVAGNQLANGFDVTAQSGTVYLTTSAVPLPPAFWLFSSGLLGFVGMARNKKT